MLIENTECAPNVIKISLGKGGLAELISKALVFPLIDAVNIGPPMYTEMDEMNQARLQKLLEVVLDRMPYILAEFKPAVSRATMSLVKTLVNYILFFLNFNRRVPFLKDISKSTLTGPILIRKTLSVLIPCLCQ